MVLSSTCRPSGFAAIAAFSGLQPLGGAALAQRTSTGLADHEKALNFRVARHLQRVDQIGRDIEKEDLNDAAELLGYRPQPEELDTALVSFIQSSTPDDEENLTRLLDRRVQRSISRWLRKAP